MLYYIIGLLCLYSTHIVIHAHIWYRPMQAFRLCLCFAVFFFYFAALIRLFCYTCLYICMLMCVSVLFFKSYQFAIAIFAFFTHHSSRIESQTERTPHTQKVCVASFWLLFHSLFSQCVHEPFPYFCIPMLFQRLICVWNEIHDPTYHNDHWTTEEKCYTKS